MFPAGLNNLIESTRTIVRSSAPPGAPPAHFDANERISRINNVAISVIQVMRGLQFCMLAPVSQPGEHDLFNEVVGTLIRKEPKSDGLSEEEKCSAQASVKSFFYPSSVHADILLAKITEMGIDPADHMTIDLVIDHYLVEKGLDVSYSQVSFMTTDSIKSQVYAKLR